MRFDVLDSLRGVFAVMIVILHTSMQSNIYYLDIVRHSDVFVEFFFVLSGFVISMSHMKSAGSPRSFQKFMIKRAGRLLPLHFFVLAAFVAIVLAKAAAASFGIFSADVPYSKSEITYFIIENIFLVHAFRNETVFWLNFPSWSISAEFWAYALFGLICLFPPRLVSWLAGVFVLLTLAVLLDFLEPGFGHFFGKGLFRGICYFIIGHFCYLIWLRIRDRNLARPALAEATVVALVLVQTSYADIEIVRLVMPLTFAATILVFTFEAGPFSRLLMTAPFRILGQRSYSIYMIHVLYFSVLGLVLRILERRAGASIRSPNNLVPDGNLLLDFGSPLVMDALTIAQVFLIVWMAKFTFLFIERPGQVFGTSLAAKL